MQIFNSIIGPIPEWTQPSRLAIGWPENHDEWGQHLKSAQDDIVNFVQAARVFGDSPIICCGKSDSRSEIRRALGNETEIWVVPMGDIWLRDTGPIFTAKGPLQFAFNGWGGKYLMDGDQETSPAICSKLNQVPRKIDWVLEGGAIESDGQGILFTTEGCVLHPNRGGQRDKENATAFLKTSLGVERVIWFRQGLINDHTDGHIDNIVRFIGPRHVLCQTPSGHDDPNAKTFHEIIKQAKEAGLKVSTIPSPGRITDSEDKICPASHLNFTILSNVVLFPSYEDVYAEKASQALGDIFPNHKAAGVKSTGLIEGGGSFHCASLHLYQN